MPRPRRPTTVLDVKVKSAPTHAASQTRGDDPQLCRHHVTFISELDGSGPAELTPPKLAGLARRSPARRGNVRRVNVDGITKAELASWKSGDTSAALRQDPDRSRRRPQAHRRHARRTAKACRMGSTSPNRFIYYVGLSMRCVTKWSARPARRPPHPDGQVHRHDAGETGLIGMIGKSERGPKTVESIKQHQAVYLMAVWRRCPPSGGESHRHKRVVAFADPAGSHLPIEFEVEDMPVTVAVDLRATTSMKPGPAYWSAKSPS